jgi:hypothetical protein
MGERMRTIIEGQLKTINIRIRDFDREELTPTERVDWFFDNYYETGMERMITRDTMVWHDLDHFEWYGEIIKIPKYKDELK